MPPIIKERIWGGTKLRDLLNKDLCNIANAGESWEISTVEDNVSIIANGSLAGVSLLDALLQYGKEILGSTLFDKFGASFPLLIKFLDAKSDLSIQVHPDDQMALQRHNCKGKTEMWYIMDAEVDSTIVYGLRKSISKEEFITKVEDGSLPAVLEKISVNAGDSFFIPSGRIHALGAGIVLAEVQQASDITYRIFDYDRAEQDVTKRDLHIDAMNLKINGLNEPKLPLNEFTTNLAKWDFLQLI